MNDLRGYEPVIGLEIHVQLSTRTKMFCACELSFGEEPNTRTCPVCLGHPGTLPTANQQAIRYGIMIGIALGCEIAPRSIFHRKNYFYPDLPKGYQISQYDTPLCSGGELVVPGGPTVRIHRAHLEEDAAKLIHHGESGRIHGAGESIVDFNRGGTPLVEIVTEPDLRSASDAREFLQLLRTTIKQIGVSDVNMEEGSLRCDANVSVRRKGEGLRAKTELKNMNSFRFIERGIEAEIERQIEMWESGSEVSGQTLHFDPGTGTLTSLRSKEEVHDYRYFPEPDLVPVAPGKSMVEEIREQIPELPVARLQRYESEYGVTDDAAQTLVNWVELGMFFEQTMALDGSVDARLMAQWITGELVARLREAGVDDPSSTELTSAALAELVVMVQDKAVSQFAAKEVLAALVNEGGEPRAIVAARDLGAIDDSSGELASIVEQALADNADAVETIKAGKQQAMGAIVGAVMRETKGRADGAEVNRLIRERLGI
ncbi:MAG: Asp-tRNA(Asn)/Glu-tRNA(Gln) amidotransferase subunit GatB [Solirubrobacterales bacterium]